MQIHADWKGKVALDDITMGQRCTKCHGNTISRFHLIAHYVSGSEFFTRNYILRQPPHSGIVFDSQATTASIAIVRKV